MAGSTTGSWWQYSVWVKNTARNMRITEPTGAELTAVKTFLKAIWNPQTQTGTRSWLETKFNKLAVASDYQGDIDVEPTHVLVEMLNAVGRDLKKIPMTAAEEVLSDALFTATTPAMFGTGPKFGGVAGSGVTIV
jgi:hypothetical protein